MVHEIVQHYAHFRIIKFIVITKVGIYTSQKIYNSKQTVQILRYSHLTSGIKLSDFWLGLFLPYLKHSSIEDCFLFKSYVLTRQNGIIVHQSGYKALFLLQVTSSNKDVIAFPHKCLTDIVTFIEKCSGHKVCHRMGDTNMNDPVSKLLEGFYFALSTPIPQSFYVSRNTVLNK